MPAVSFCPVAPTSQPALQLGEQAMLGSPAANPTVSPQSILGCLAATSSVQTRLPGERAAPGLKVLPTALTGSLFGHGAEGGSPQCHERLPS